MMDSGTDAAHLVDARPKALPAIRSARIKASEEPASATGNAAGRIEAPKEWRRALTGVTLGLLLFETITGLTIYLLPFSKFNQFGVLLHTLVGVLMVAPVGVYIGQHWWRRFRSKFNHYQLLGYATTAAVLILTASGLVLTWQALFGVRIGYGWDLVHIIFTFAFVAFLGAHLATLIWRKVNNPDGRRALRSAHRSCLIQSMAWGGGLTMLCGLAAVGYVEDSYRSAFPPNYSFKYGVDRPFAPSLARKDMGDVEENLRNDIAEVLDGNQRRVFLASLRVDPSEHIGIATAAERLCADMALSDEQRAGVAQAVAEARERYRQESHVEPRLLAGSAGCGTSGCHSEILDEWLPSAHRYASMDFVFQKVQENMAKETAPEATRYCAGCHDPISLLGGAKNVGNLTLSAEGSDEGVSCLVCHSMIQTDVRGNADYTIRPPRRYLYELRDGAFAKTVSDFLIRAYPRQHVASYARPLYKTAESCGACHKQFIDEEINNFGWVQGQNQYDSWRKSRWHTEDDVTRTVGCRECHMPLQASADPAAGDAQDFNRTPVDGRHRSHRFLAANQFVPRHHDLEGAEEQCRLTEAWLRGEYPIPEIAERWTSGPVIRLDLVVPDAAVPGEELSVQTILVNNKAGHDFPTGPLDMIEGWVELTVTDERGRVIYASARPDERGYLTNPQIVFKAEPIDRYGELVGEHDLWNMVGGRFKRSLFPGFTDTTSFTFECPAMPTDPAQRAELVSKQDTQVTLEEPIDGDALKVEAVLWYCKFSAPFLDRLFGEEANVRSKASAIARADALIPIVREKGATR